MIGCWLLRYLLDSNNGCIVTALSKYNTGPNAEFYNLNYASKVLITALNL